MTDRPDSYDPSIARRIELAKQAEAGDAVRDPLPAPLVPWRPATGAELGSCATAGRLALKAQNVGYDVIVRYAQGPYIGANGEALDPTTEALALVFRWAGVEAYAWWARRTGAEKWAVESAWILAPAQRLTATDLGYWLTGEAPPPPKKKKVKT